MVLGVLNSTHGLASILLSNSSAVVALLSLSYNIYQGVRDRQVKQKMIIEAEAKAAVEHDKDRLEKERNRLDSEWSRLDGQNQVLRSELKAEVDRLNTRLEEALKQLSDAKAEAQHWHEVAMKQQSTIEGLEQRIKQLEARRRPTNTNKRRV